MNKLLLLVLALAFLVIDSNAQVLVGPVLGGNVNWVKFKNHDEQDKYDLGPGLGFHTGASVSFRVRKRFFLQTSILYSKKVKSIQESKNNLHFDGDYSNKLKLNFIEMPILYTAEFKGKLGDKNSKEFKWFLGAGPTISYWLGGRGEFSDGDLVELNVNSLPYKITFDKKREDVEKGEMNIKDANRMQLGLNIAAGLILEPVGFNKIMITLRYEHGHSFFSQKSKGYFGGFDGDLYYEDDLQVRLQTLLVSLQYYIDLKTDQRKKGKSVSDKKGRRKN
jgi:hypothetical protein